MHSSLLSSAFTYVLKIALLVGLLIVTSMYLISSVVLSTNQAALARMADRIKDEVDKTGKLSTTYTKQLGKVGYNSTGDPGTAQPSDPPILFVWSDSEVEKLLDAKQSPTPEAGMIVTSGLMSINNRLEYGNPMSFVVFRKIRLPFVNTITRLAGNKALTTISERRTSVNRGYVQMEKPTYGYERDNK